MRNSFLLISTFFSLDPPYIFPTYYNEKMPQTEKQLLMEIHKMLKETAEKQDNLGKEIKKINEKLDTLTDPNNHKHTEEKQNTEALVNYFETHYGHLRDMGKFYIQEEAYKARKQKLWMWKNLLNKRKLAFYNAIKSKETARIYNNFLEMEQIYIPRKIREKTTPQDTEEQKNIKMDLNITKLNAQVKILEDKTLHYTTKYLEIDDELLAEIETLCPKETRPFLSEQWKRECEKEEEKSTQIVEKKKLWLTNLPEREKETLRKEEERKKLKRDKLITRVKTTPVNRTNNINHQHTNYRRTNVVKHRTNNHIETQIPNRDYRHTNNTYTNQQHTRRYNTYADATNKRIHTKENRFHTTGTHNEQQHPLRTDHTRYIGQHFRNKNLRRQQIERKNNHPFFLGNKTQVREPT